MILKSISNQMLDSIYHYIIINNNNKSKNMRQKWGSRLLLSPLELRVDWYEWKSEVGCGLMFTITNGYIQRKRLKKRSKRILLVWIIFTDLHVHDKGNIFPLLSTCKFSNPIPPFSFHLKSLCFHYVGLLSCVTQSHFKHYFWTQPWLRSCLENV